MSPGDIAPADHIAKYGAGPMADLTPAETLRAAAKVLRETASKGDVAWIGLASPALAEPLADWLKVAGDDLGGAEAYLARTVPPGEIFDPFDYVDEPNSCEHALAVARAILGRPS